MSRPPQQPVRRGDILSKQMFGLKACEKTNARNYPKRGKHKNGAGCLGARTLNGIGLGKTQIFHQKRRLAKAKPRNNGMSHQSTVVYLRYLGGNSVSKLAQLAHFSEQGHQPLGVIYHQNSPLVDVHELRKRTQEVRFHQPNAW